MKNVKAKKRNNVNKLRQKTVSVKTLMKNENKYLLRKTNDDKWRQFMIRSKQRQDKTVLKKLKKTRKEKSKVGTK